MDQQKKTKEHLLRENKELSKKTVILEKRLTDFQEQFSFFQILLETLPNPAFYKDTKGRYLWCNKAFEEYHGISRENLYGKTFLELKPNYYEPEIAHKVDMDLISRPGEATYEVVLNLPDGKKSTLINHKATLKKDDGSAAGIVGIQIDITERKDFEEELRQREAKLTSIFRAAPAGIGVVSNRVLLDVNERICEMTGYTREELIGQNARIFYPTDEDYEYVGREKYRQIGEKGTGTVETLWQRKDGRIINVLLSSTPIDPDNLAQGVTFTALDITERKHAEEALRKSEADYRSVIENIQDVFYRSDAAGNLIMASPSFASLLGYDSISECFGKPIAETFYYDPGKRKELLRDIKKNGSIRNYEVILKKKDGTPLTVETSSHMLFNNKREFAGVEGVFRDVTERKQMEESIREGEKKFRVLFENASDAIFIANETVFLDCNAKALTLFNCIKEDIIGHSPVEFSPELQPDGLLSLKKAEEKIKLALKGNPQIFEWIHITKNGTPVDTEISLNSFEYAGNTYIHAIIRDISKRKQAEDALQSSERNLKAIVDGSPIPQFVIDKEHRIIHWNKALEEYSGLKAADLTGTNQQWRAFYGKHRPCMADLIVDGSIELIDKWYSGKYSRSRLLKDAYEATDFFPDMKGGTWLYFTAAPIYDNENNIIGAVETLADITEQKRSQEELKTKAEELDQYFTGSLDLLCIADMNGYFRRLNPEWKKTLGYSLEELEGQRFLDFVHPDDLNATLEAITTLSGQKEILNFENRYRAKDGTYRWIEWRSIPRGNSIYAVARDITERKRAEEALKQSEQNFRMLFENAPFGMLMVMRNGTISLINAKFKEMFGYTREEIPDGRTWFRKAYPDEVYRHEVISVWKEDIKTAKIGEKRPRVFTVKCKDSSIRIINFITVLLESGDILVACEDITKRKRAEDALRQSELFLKESHRIARLGGWKANPNTDYLEWTEGVYEIIEASPDYKPPLTEGLKFFLPEYISIIREKVIECLNTGNQFIMECESTTTSGKHLWTEVRGLAPVIEGERAYVMGTFQDITERKLAEEMIQASRKQLLDIIDFLPDATLVIDKERRILIWNKAIEKMTGIPASEMVGKAGYIYTIPFYGEARKSLMDLLFEESKETEAKYPFITREGDTIMAEVFCNALYGNRGAWVFAIASPLYDKTGNIIGAIESMRDISERKMAEVALRESEEKYRSIFENAVEGFFQTTVDGGFLSANPFLANLLGFGSPRELIETLTNIGEQHYADPKDRETFKNILESQGSISQYETKLLKKDGTIIWASINARAVRDEKGSISHYEGILTDITERKRAEKALLESEQRYRDLYENLRDGSVAVDISGRIVDCNRRFLDMLGYTMDEIKNLSYEDVTPAKWHAMELKTLKEQVEGRGYSDVYEKEYIRKDGRIFPVEIQKYLMAGTESGALRYWAFVRDISERKRAEEEKDALQTQLMQAQKMESVGRLAGGVAHDFNNMLNVILGYTELAKEEIEPDRPLYGYLDEIRKSAQRSTDLTRQLLAFARKQTIAPKVLDLNETIDGMLKILRRLIGEDINLVWMPGAALWQVKIDPSQIDQLLANLCVNARDAISGVGKVTIETENIVFDEEYCAVHSGFAPGDYVMLAVSDDGIGMDKEVFSHLFEPFFTTKDLGKGTGLGLATVYGIVKQNNGFINVYSEPGHGSSFKIYIPRLAHEETYQKIETRPETPKGHGELVLLVEDDTAMLGVSHTMLETLGYRVISAGTPGEALRLARENASELDMLFTDVVMPDMNGRDLAGLLNEIKPGLKCLFASGYTADVIAHHGVLDEGVNFIQKPYSLHNLGKKLREVLDK